MNLIVGSIGETVKTRKITTTIVALTLIFMATSTIFNETNELQPEGIIEFSHEGVANGTAILGGILSWQDDMWDSSWNCSGGLALVAPLDWDDFVASGEHDPHNYTSWGIGITGADSYYTENAPEGEWVVTAGLDCIDDMGDARSAGGQYGDVHENPPTVNLTNGTTTGDVSFTLIEYAEHTFVCGDGNEIPFSYVNDGDEDCDDGSDEQQYDADGNEINWFDCHDGTMIWVHQVNDGNEDCPDGEDELGDEMSLEEIMEMIDADGDGFLSLDEIIDFINEIENDESGENISQEEEDMISDVFTESDADSDGLLDIDELETFADLMDDMDDGNDGPTFVCGDGDEIPFNWVNDGDEDCDDGSDEQQYDADGNEINWFDCHDGTMIWVHQVNDGNEDCPDGEDEGGSDSPDADEIMEEVDADGDGHLSLDEILDYVNEESYDESGENISQEEEDMISGAFADSDADGDGLLDINELGDFIDLTEEMAIGNDGPTFVCGDGDEIPFNWVNDGGEDCDDGSDEQQYDADGNEINWFDCHDGTMIWVHQVNDGNEDCSDGEDEGVNNDEYPNCSPLMNINFNQTGWGNTAELTFYNTCVFDSEDSANMLSYWDTDGDGDLSSEELTAAQDGMNEEEVCYAEDGTEVPCADDDGDDGLFSYDGTVMITQPEIGDDSMSILSVDAGIVTISSITQVITVNSDDALLSHTFGYDAGADWDGGNDECMGGVMITATSPWSVSNVSFLPITDWSAAMLVDGSGWMVENSDADGDGHCNSQPSEVVIVFTTPEPEPEPVYVEGCMNSTATNYNADATVDDGTCVYPEPVVDTAPTCEIYYNIGGVALTTDSTWSVEIQSAVSVEMPADGEFSLALPVGEYSVIMVCNDAEGDAIVVSGTNGDETWNGTAQDGVIYSEGVFVITDADVNESVDVTLTWSSTTFSGTFNTHFTAVESLTDAIEETDVGALPGFTSMISITAMLGAALILARRKD